MPRNILGLMMFSLSAIALGADDAGEWLLKMNHALASRNYDGTFFHLNEGRVETMRIVHRVKAGKVTERLLSLDGSGREFVRSHDELTCYLPDQHTVLVEPSRDGGSFLGSLPQFNAGGSEFYRIESLPTTRILGRMARVIAVTPKDEYRFGYKLWLDEKSGMPLKTQLCDARGQVLEQILFARLDMPDSIPDSDLVAHVLPKGMRWVRQGAVRDNTSAALEAFRAGQLPPGFHLTISGMQTIGAATVPTRHLVYSDGMATVSVFVEDDKAPVSQDPPMQGLARVGSGFAFSTVVQGHQVTAVGEVPAQTVESIAHSVRSYSTPH